LDGSEMAVPLDFDRARSILKETVNVRAESSGETLTGSRA
jgi:hypothetical protein